MTLFIFDFDQTITNGHTHKTISMQDPAIIAARKTATKYALKELSLKTKPKPGTRQAKAYITLFKDKFDKLSGLTDKKKVWDNELQQWGFVRQIEPLGAASKWQAIFEKLAADGHQIAIASFNSFGHVIPRFLEEKIGLSKKLIATIHIESWLPQTIGKANTNKNEHIANIKAHYGIDAASKDVCLIDDSTNNITAASKLGYQTITATDFGSHLSELERRLDLLKAPPTLTVSGDGWGSGSGSFDGWGSGTGSGENWGEGTPDGSEGDAYNQFQGTPVSSPTLSRFSYFEKAGRTALTKARDGTLEDSELSEDTEQDEKKERTPF